jgi:hypothetical protein
VHADLVVLSAATPDSGRRAMEATGEIAAACPGLDVLIGMPGDSLDDLRRFARALREPGPAERLAAEPPEPEPRPGQREQSGADQRATAASHPPEAARTSSTAVSGPA